MEAAGTAAVDSLQLAAAAGCEHDAVVGCIKSIQSHDGVSSLPSGRLS